MPIALSPNRVCPVHLQVDAEIPEDQRPVFLFRFLTADEADELLRRRDEIITSPIPDSQAKHEINELLRPYLKGWRNMRTPEGQEIPWDPQAGPSAVCSLRELFELVVEAVHQTSLGEVEKKSSPSPPTSEPERSAQGAAAESA